MTHTWKTLAVALCLALPGWSMAADEDPDKEAAHVRHALMEVMGWNMKTVAAMSTGKQPYDQARAEIHGQRIAALAGMIADAFARDTSGANLKTEALDAIWLNQAEFDNNAVKLGDAARDYAAATADGEAAAKKAFISLGGSCKGCHEDFKSE
jgi:cytochrome c556